MILRPFACLYTKTACFCFIRNCLHERRSVTLSGSVSPLPWTGSKGCIYTTIDAFMPPHMFSVPRGYNDGFVQWMKQVIAICLTAFMQTTLLFLGLLTFPGNMLLGLGIMLAANEVPRIAQQFGLDSSVRVNMMSVVHATTTAVNLTRSIAKAK